MKIKTVGWAVRILAILGLAIGTGALAQSPQRATFQGTINDYTPASPPVSGPWEVRGPWSLVVKSPWKADFSAALTMERSDQGVIQNGDNFDFPANRSAHTHHITMVNGAVTRTATGFQVVGPATITKDGVFPPPFGPTLPILTITISGSTVKYGVLFSNITVLFGAPADGHFGTNPLHGVIRSVDKDDLFGR